ncbi:DNA polymerase III subunit delta [Congregibacter brevis]|uniref:DNA polymerase III subunit delta n=1 Tax=Congregibacter brevis TaxID=3081201 RepID=A0ABZ0IGD5_9GAMM|nr:DNA polymerase III subunit delta [Congregibacter sp. IMCC45268]
MRIYPEKLAQDLDRKLHRVYLISGDETLLVQECADQVRAAARRAGCHERHVVDSSDRSFSWQDLTQDSSSMSLFAEQRLIEVRIPNGKPGTEGSKALQEYLDHAPESDTLLIVAGKIDKASTNSKWYKAIDQAGATIQLWPVNAEELPRWLERRARSINLSIDRDGLTLLAERVEGNLLAAVQELEKLRLLAGDSMVTAKQVAHAVANSARFDTFALIDVALGGRSDDSLRMLHGLRSEGTQPPALLWGLIRELRLLRGLMQAVEAGRQPMQALNEARVWKSRQSVIQAAMRRHSVASCEELLSLAAHVDGCIKGYAQGDPWEQTEWLIAGLARDGKPTLSRSA